MRIRPTATVALSLGLAALSAGCSDRAGAPLEPNTVSLSMHSRPTTPRVIDGSTRSGSLYRLVRPANWNGILLLYAHGWVSPDSAVALPAEGEMLGGLVAPQGFAIAYSSFSANGWDIEDGAKRTHELLETFTEAFGRPRSTYITGASMGGLIAIKLAETYPRSYAGALAACAVAGGTRRLFEYHANVRALFDFFYPGVLPGSAALLPPGTDLTTGIIMPATAAIGENATLASYITAIDQTPIPFASPAEFLQSTVTALAGNAVDLADPVLTRGRPFFDNRRTEYSSALLPLPLLQAINAGVGRFRASRRELEALERNYTPTGDPRIPMLMLSNARDPEVPAYNQSSYLAAVTAHGAADLLIQREVPAYGHCVFTPDELGAAVSDLVQWGEQGGTPGHRPRRERGEEH